MPIITIDLNGDELFYDFDHRSKDEFEPISVSITDEEYEQLIKLKVEMDKLQKILHDKYKEAEALKKAFDDLHKPPVVIDTQIEDALLDLGEELEEMKKSYRDAMEKSKDEYDKYEYDTIKDMYGDMYSGKYSSLTSNETIGTRFKKIFDH